MLKKQNQKKMKKKLKKIKNKGMWSDVLWIGGTSLITYLIITIFQL